MELASQRKMDVAEAVASTCSGRVIYTGKVNMVDRHVQGSFTRGMCTIVPLESNLPSTATEEVKKHLELTFENEYILAALKSPRKSGCEENQEPEVLALTPDLIAVCHHTRNPLCLCSKLILGSSPNHRHSTHPMG